MTAYKRRFLKLLTGLAALGAAGLGYAWLVDRLGRGLSCPFYRLTGYLCPGCGVSRMCMALLRGDWAGARAANPALFFLLPVLAGLLVWRVVGYVKGHAASRGESRCWLALAVGMLGFGVIRNIW